MSVSNTVSTLTYSANGSLTTFAIPFVYFINSQVKVLVKDTNNVSAIQTEGVHYTISGSNVVFGTAPTSGYLVTIYRETVKTQEASYLSTSSFPAATHEKALDRIVMMIQELSRDLTSVSSSNLGGALVRAASQTVPNSGGIITVPTSQRAFKFVDGTSGSSIAEIANGTIDGQELKLFGSSDTNPVVLEQIDANLALNGDMVLYSNSAIDLIWNNINNKWNEVSRR